MLNRKS